MFVSLFAKTNHRIPPSVAMGHFRFPFHCIHPNIFACGGQSAEEVKSKMKFAVNDTMG